MTRLFLCLILSIAYTGNSLAQAESLACKAKKRELQAAKAEKLRLKSVIGSFAGLVPVSQRTIAKADAKVAKYTDLTDELTQELDEVKRLETAATEGAAIYAVPETVDLAIEGYIARTKGKLASDEGRNQAAAAKIGLAICSTDAICSLASNGALRSILRESVSLVNRRSNAEIVDPASVSAIDVEISGFEAAHSGELLASGTSLKFCYSDPVCAANNSTPLAIKSLNTIDQLSRSTDSFVYEAERNLRTLASTGTSREVAKYKKLGARLSARLSGYQLALDSAVQARAALDSRPTVQSVTDTRNKLTVAKRRVKHLKQAKAKLCGEYR